MASKNSPVQFVFKFDDSRKKSYESCFPGLTLPSSQNPFEEVGLHKQLSKTFDELSSRETGENTVMSENKEILNDKEDTDQNMTPKSQKQKPSDVKRWASVVKAQKKILTELDVNDKHLSEGVELTSDIFDCIFKTFPKSFESHKGFFIINDKMFFCNICSLNLDSILSLSNHLKTRKHEDNAIEYFKTEMPAHLHYIMEFVSFYGSNLCCNLCRCKIPMSSHNPHMTIVNIMAHNSDESHISKKVNQETCNTAETILQTLSASSHIILENSHFIERKMVPEFRCQLCKTVIVYNDNKEVLSQNMISHMKSVGHLKNQKAVEVLKLFGEASITGKDNWTVINGNIMCTYCNREMETNLQQLISHVNDVEHATKVLFKLGISSNFSKVSESNSLQDNMINEAKSSTINKSKKEEGDKKQSTMLESISAIQLKPGCRLKDLLSTMPPGLKNIDYVIENEKGSITCLICNRVVPPSTYNLKTHLLGNKHKINMELRNEVAFGGSNRTSNGTLIQNPNSEGTKKDQTNTFSVPSKPPKKLLDGQTISKRLGYVLKTDKGSTTCAICQYPLLNPNLADEHLASDEHKKRENLWLKNCPGCSSRNPFTFSVLKALPTSIRTYKCRQMETIPGSVLNHLYSLLLKENQLVEKNKDFLIKNVDGKHSYCSLCKALIPLSLDLDILEHNVVSHLKEKRHLGFVTDQNENAQDVSTSPTVARSLFNIPDEFQNLGKDSKVYNFEDFARFICKDPEVKIMEEKRESSTKKVLGGVSNEAFQGTKETESGSLENEDNACSAKKQILTDQVFVFGKDDLSLKNSKNLGNITDPGQNKVLPVANVTRLVKFEEETSEDVLSRRQKQIDYGKNTEGYARYCKLIPRRKRGIHHPATPPKHLRCSRRTWDGMIRAWRRQLHSWDSPSSTLDSDIRPLD